MSTMRLDGRFRQLPASQNPWIASPRKSLTTSPGQTVSAHSVTPASPRECVNGSAMPVPCAPQYLGSQRSIASASPQAHIISNSCTSPPVPAHCVTAQAVQSSGGPLTSAAYYWPEEAPHQLPMGTPPVRRMFSAPQPHVSAGMTQPEPSVPALATLDQPSIGLASWANLIGSISEYSTAQNDLPGLGSLNSLQQLGTVAGEQPPRRDWGVAGTEFTMLSPRLPSGYRSNGIPSAAITSCSMLQDVDLVLRNLMRQHEHLKAKVIKNTHRLAGKVHQAERKYLLHLALRTWMEHLVAVKVDRRLHAASETRSREAAGYEQAIARKQKEVQALSSESPEIVHMRLRLEDAEATIASFGRALQQNAEQAQAFVADSPPRSRVEPTTSVEAAVQKMHGALSELDPRYIPPVHTPQFRRATRRSEVTAPQQF